MKHQPRIVVVDDDPAIIEIIRTILENQSYNVFTAEDGEKGLFLIREKQPHLIILDVKMPKISGYLLAELLKKESKLAHIPIILLTGESRLTGNISLEQPTAYRLTKPFNVDELTDLVKDILNQERRRILDQRKQLSDDSEQDESVDHSV